GKVLKDNKEKVFVLDYSGRKGKKIQKGKVVGKKKAQKIKNCREKGRLLRERKIVRKRESLLGEEKVIEKSEGYWEKRSLSEEGRVVGRRE
ncbi:28680_t:CDS:1, partial [Gigaspora margarita]